MAGEKNPSDNIDILAEVCYTSKRDGAGHLMFCSCDKRFARCEYEESVIEIKRGSVGRTEKDRV